MEDIVLIAETRKIKGKQVKALRREGRLPAVVYGHGFQPLAISLDLRESSKILSTVTSSHLVIVKVDGIPHTTLVRDKQRNPILGSLIHVDFQEVSLTEKLRTLVPIELDGESPAVKKYDGIIVLSKEQLEVEAFPGDLPERIIVDISVLRNIGDTINVRDIVVSGNVELLDDANEIVVVVTAPSVRVEIEGEEIASIEPEVIERGKKEEGI